jgi:hypothetical protein
MRLLGFVLLLSVLIVGFSILTRSRSEPAMLPAPVVVPGPSAPDPRVSDLESQVATLESQLDTALNSQPAPQPDAPVVISAPSQTQDAAGGDCHVVADGYLETNQIIGAPDAQFVHGVYWFQGQPEYNVLLNGAQFQRPRGAGGRYWAYGGGGCTRDFVAAQIAGHIERTTIEGVNSGGMGDPSLFSRVS